MAQANKYRRFGLNLGWVFDGYHHHPATDLTIMTSAMYPILA
tara:strand:- start:354 stop:479 length:126 start_codon:yes stop_codon:yes gene_type:complete